MFSGSLDYNPFFQGEKGLTNKFKEEHLNKTSNFSGYLKEE